MADPKKPFFIGLNRAMISLGPLNQERYCPYKCAFCYVQSDEWGRYAQCSVEEILAFLRKERSNYKVIYISGDTDSFAPPRTKKALSLLRSLLEFNVDVTITTRYVFNEKELNELEDIFKEYQNKGLVLSVSISIPRLYSADHLESINTPSPQDRIKFLKELKLRGIWTMLAMRPLLPVIKLDEYKQLILQCKDHVDAVLGEVWYVDHQGLVERRVLIDDKDKKIKFEDHSMDFNVANTTWKVWKNDELIQDITDHCESLKVPFFMRSQPALDHIKKLSVTSK